MSNFDDRVEDIKFWRTEILRLRGQMRLKSISKQEREDMETEIEELEFAIEATQQSGGIPDFY